MGKQKSSNTSFRTHQPKRDFGQPKRHTLKFKALFLIKNVPQLPQKNVNILWNFCWMMDDKKLIEQIEKKIARNATINTNNINSLSSTTTTSIPLANTFGFPNLTHIFFFDQNLTWGVKLLFLICFDKIHPDWKDDWISAIKKLSPKSRYQEENWIY